MSLGVAAIIFFGLILIFVCIVFWDVYQDRKVINDMHAKHRAWQEIYEPDPPSEDENLGDA